MFVENVAFFLFCHEATEALSFNLTFNEIHPNILITSYLHSSFRTNKPYWKNCSNSVHFARKLSADNDKRKLFWRISPRFSFEKTNSQQMAVLDIDRGTQDLQQCADAVMRLRAEYLYNQKRIEDISFKTFGGVAMNYAQYKQGYRLTNQGFRKTKGVDNSRVGFRKYLDMVFSYANTYTLEKEMKAVKNLKDLQIGDVFIVSNPKSYGHAMIVMDVAENQQTKDKIFLLAQSYMPAQDIHIVKNPRGGVWYSLKDLGNELFTPEWTFPVSALHRF
jgi:Domain of unknown function (4846)